MQIFNVMLIFLLLSEQISKGTKVSEGGGNLLELPPPHPMKETQDVIRIATMSMKFLMVKLTGNSFMNVINCVHQYMGLICGTNFQQD